MSVIRKNPYRILGLFSNSTEKELQKQIAIISRYSEVGKLKSFDCDFPFLGDFKREQQTVLEAASRIEQAKNKIHYAIFWFLRANHIDEAALNHLKDNNIEKAIEIWEKFLKDNVITSKNYSAALNLSTLQLGITTLNGTFNYSHFKNCIELKERIISSDTFLDFVKSVAGTSINIRKDMLLREFVDEVLQILKPYLNKLNGITYTQIIETFRNFPLEIKQYLLGKFTDRPLSNIENQVEKTKQKRIDNSNGAIRYGEELYKTTKEDLLFLRNVLGVENVQFQVVLNNVAQEILQCAIDFFIHYRDSNEFDPGDESIRLMEIAKSILPSGQVKSRIDENIENLQQWIANKPERDRYNRVKDELDFIGKKLEQFQRLAPSIANAKGLVVSCNPSLNNMKKILGSVDDFYLKISSAIVANAQGMLVSVVNDEQELFQFIINPNSVNIQNVIKILRTRNKAISMYNLADSLPDRYTAISNLKSTVRSALEVTSMIGSLDMNLELKNQYNNNKRTLQNIVDQFEMNSSRSSGSSGCYIATMAYGSYEHPQVLELRKFRDNTLSKSSIGKGFIKTYYKYSPRLVENLKDKPLVNKTIKSILNIVIRIIK